MTGIEMEIQNAYCRGWTFTPLNGKKPLLPGWTTAPRHTLNQAIEWSRAGNLGLRTGSPSRVGVIDIDPGASVTPKDFPPTVTVVTGRGGWHLYFSVDSHLPNSVSKIARGVDVRGDGGQVVFVGGVHPDTRHRYWWMPGHSPDDVRMASFPWPAPEPVLPPVTAARHQITPADNAEARCLLYLAKLPTAVSGSGGHSATFHAACVCRKFGLEEIAMWRAMHWFNQEKCDPPWGERELAHKIRQAIASVDADGRFGEMLVDRSSDQRETWPSRPPLPADDEIVDDEIEAY